jgi:hypothetical protein
MDHVLNAIRKIMSGTEVECDRAYVTDDAIYVRHNRVWVELKPKKWQVAGDVSEAK